MTPQELEELAQLSMEVEDDGYMSAYDIQTKDYGTADSDSMVSNIASGIGERAATLGSNLLKTGEDLTGWLNSNLGEIVIGTEGVDYYSPEDIASGKMDGKKVEILKGGSEYLGDVDLGYEADFTVDKLLESKGLWDGIKNTAGLIVEQGFVSAPDMAALIVNAPAYLASRTTELSYERAGNNNRDEPTGEDRVFGTATAFASLLVDKFGLSKVQAKDLAGTLVKSLAKKAGYEAGTEAVQEVMEYTGTTLGTEKGFQATEAGKAALGGALGGAGVGAAFGVPSALKSTRELDAADQVNKDILQDLEEELDIEPPVAAKETPTATEPFTKTKPEPVVPEQDFTPEQMGVDVLGDTAVVEDVVTDKAVEPTITDKVVEAEQELERVTDTTEVEDANYAVIDATDKVTEAERTLATKPKNPTAQAAVGKAKAAQRKAMRKQEKVLAKQKVKQAKKIVETAKTEADQHLADNSILVGDTVKIGKKEFEYTGINETTGKATVQQVKETKTADGELEVVPVEGTEQEVEVTSLKKAREITRKAKRKLTKKEEANIAEQEQLNQLMKPTTTAEEVATDEPVPTPKPVTEPTPTVAITPETEAVKEAPVKPEVFRPELELDTDGTTILKLDDMGEPEVVNLSKKARQKFFDSRNIEDPEALAAEDRGRTPLQKADMKVRRIEEKFDRMEGKPSDLEMLQYQKAVREAETLRQEEKDAAQIAAMESVVKTQEAMMDKLEGMEQAAAGQEEVTVAPEEDITDVEPEPVVEEEPVIEEPVEEAPVEAEVDEEYPIPDERQQQQLDGLTDAAVDEDAIDYAERNLELLSIIEEDYGTDKTREFKEVAEAVISRHQAGVREAIDLDYKAKNPSTKAEIQAEFKDMFNTTFESGNVTIHETAADLNPSQRENRSPQVVAFITPTGRIHIIADRVNKGEGVSLLMHEKGVHELLKETPEYKRVVSNIDRILADPNNWDYGVVKAARDRALFAQSKSKNPDAYPVEEETIAYLIQEKTIDKGFLKSIIRTLQKAFRTIMGDKNANLNVSSMVMLVDGMVREQANRLIAAEKKQVAEDAKAADIEAELLAKIGGSLESIADSPDPALVTDYYTAPRTNYVLQYDIVGQSKDTVFEAYHKLKAKGLGFVPTRPLMNMLDRELPSNTKVSDIQDFYDKAEAAADIRIEQLDEQLIKPLQRYQRDNNVEYQTMVRMALRASQRERDITNTKSFKQLSEDGQQLYKDILAHYKAMAKDKIDVLTSYTQSLDINADRKKEMMDIVKNLSKQITSNAAYVPFNRFGNFKVEGELPSGERYVSHHDTLHAASQAKARLQSDHGKDFTIDEVVSYQQASKSLFTSEAYTKADTFIKDALGDQDPRSAKAATEALWQTFLEYSPQAALSRKVAARKSVMGMSADMVRGLGQSVHRDIRYNERLKVKGEVDKVFTKVSKAIDDIKGDKVVAKELYNELRQREVVDVRAPWSKNITKANFGYYLGFNPASAMVNLTQNAIVAMPVLSADYNTAKVFGKMNKNFFQVAKNLSAKGMKNDFGYTGTEAEAIKRMMEDGTINITQAHMMTGINEGHTADFNPDGMGGKFTNAMAYMFHRAEIANRATTAMTAFQLKWAETKDFEASLKYAKDKTYESQFDFSETGKSRYQRSDVGNVLLAMKSYPISMAVYMTQNFNRWLLDSKATPEEQKAARTKFMGTMIATTLLGGSAALPLSGLIPEVFNMLFGDDEEDPQKIVRDSIESVAGETLGGVIMDGLVGHATGLDITSKVSLGLDMFARVQGGQSAKQMQDAIIAGALGPVGGMATNFVRGWDMIDEGKYGSGITTMMPAAARNVFKGAEWGIEGRALTSKDTLITEIETHDAILKALGFNPLEYAEYFDESRAEYRKENAIRKKRKYILRKHAWAVVQGKASERKDARSLVREYNRGRPQTEWISESSLKRAVRDLRKRLAGEK